MSEAGEMFDEPRPGCTGDGDCPAPAHQHGCFADLAGHCNEPEAHVEVAGEQEREALARLVWDATGKPRHLCSFDKIANVVMRAELMDCADAILAAGYRREPEPRTVTTVEELDALQVDTIGIVSHPGGPIAVQYTGPRGWYLAADSRLISTAELLRVAGPITILFTPSTEVI